MSERRQEFPPEVRKQILERDAYTCQVCSASDPTGRTLAADHIIPWYWGGESTLENGRTLCVRCHATAGVARTREDWLRRKNPLDVVFDFF